MRKHKYPLAILLILFMSSFASDKLPSSLVNLLARSKMTFEKPKELTETKMIENDQMHYEYAMKYGDKNFEVRIAIRPLDVAMKEFAKREMNKKAGDVNICPNQIYESSFQATLMNISGGQLPKTMAYRKEDVMKEFNADWGATSFVEVGPEFAQKYKYCMVVALHKDNVADAYYFYLSDTRDGFAELMKPAFHSLRFK